MATPLPTWKDLTYDQLDKSFGDAVHREVQQVISAKFSTTAIDVFIVNVKAMSDRLGTLRARVGAAL